MALFVPGVAHHAHGLDACSSQEAVEPWSGSAGAARARGVRGGGREAAGRAVRQEGGWSECREFRGLGAAVQVRVLARAEVAGPDCSIYSFDFMGTFACATTAFLPHALAQQALCIQLQRGFRHGKSRIGHSRHLAQHGAVRYVRRLRILLPRLDKLVITNAAGPSTSRCICHGSRGLACSSHASVLQ